MRPDPRVQAVPPFLHHLARSIEDINMLALVILTNTVTMECRSKSLSEKGNESKCKLCI